MQNTREQRYADLTALAQLPREDADDLVIAQVVADTLLHAVVAGGASQVAILAGMCELLANTICATGLNKGDSRPKVIADAESYGQIIVEFVRNKLFAHERN